MLSNEQLEELNKNPKFIENNEKLINSINVVLNKLSYADYFKNYTPSQIMAETISWGLELMAEYWGSQEALKVGLYELNDKIYNSIKENKELVSKILKEKNK